MTEYECRALLLRVGEALGLADPQGLADRRQARIDELPVHLHFDAALHPERLVLQVELGEIPSPQRALALERLMRLNLLSGSKTTGVFALAPFGWQLLYAVHLFDLSQRAPAAVARGIRQHLQTARAACEAMQAAEAEPQAHAVLPPHPHLVRS